MKTHTQGATALLAMSALLSAVPAQAALKTYSFTGALDSGAFIGETFAGQFSYEDTALTGIDSEYLNVSTLDFSFHQRAFTQDDAAAATEVAFMDGVFRGLSFAVTSFDPKFALTPGVVDMSDAYFAYQPNVGTSGYGSVAYTLAPVPEPATSLMMLAGLALLVFRAGTRV